MGNSLMVDMYKFKGGVMYMKTVNSNVGSMFELTPHDAALIVNSKTDKWKLQVPVPYRKKVEIPRSVLFLLAMTVIWEKDEGRVDELIGEVIPNYDPSKY